MRPGGPWRRRGCFFISKPFSLAARSAFYFLGITQPARPGGPMRRRGGAKRFPVNKRPPLAARSAFYFLGITQPVRLGGPRRRRGCFFINKLFSLAARNAFYFWELPSRRARAAPCGGAGLGFRGEGLKNGIPCQAPGVRCPLLPLGSPPPHVFLVVACGLFLGRV